MLEVKDLKKYFKLSNGKQIRAVDGVSLRVKENEILGIVGESGCGKSTLGRLILRLIDQDAGQVYFDGEEITRLSRNALRSKRRKMQMVFQNPYSSFNPKIRIGDALMEVCNYYDMSFYEGSQKIKRLLRDIGLSDDMLNRWPRELSGGQLQRLAIARAIIGEPSLLIADEPLSAMDVSVQAQLLNLLDDLRSTRSMAMIFISHDMTVVEYFCDTVAVMYLGRIMELVSAEELSYNAMHPYTRSLRACAPRLDVFKDTAAEKALPIYGETPNPKALLKGCPFAPRCHRAMPVCFKTAPEPHEVSPGHWVRCYHLSSHEPNRVFTDR
jgi:oligopeptide/dipeptide ABC transporter ATP-binding protein